MLDPFYLQPSPLADSNEIKIETYKVTAYSQADRFVLIYWEVQSAEPIFSRKTNKPEQLTLAGQTLWKGREHIFTRYGKTALYKRRQAIPETGNARKIHNNWLEENIKEGRPYYGLPEAIALKLESSQNIQYL